VTLTAALGIAALAGGVQGWLFKRATVIERWLLVAAGLALVYPTALFDVIGLVLVAVVCASQYVRRDASPRNP